MAPGFAWFGGGTGRHPCTKDLSRTQRCGRESYLFALLGQAKRQGTDAWSSKQHRRELGDPCVARRYDQVDGPRPVARPLLVCSRARSPNGVANRADTRRNLVYRKGEDPVSGEKFPLQSERDATACAGKRRHDRQE